MDTDQPSFESADYMKSGNLSEADSLSDSDWLDVARNSDTDDNDSLSSADSDHNESTSSPSRRSSISIGSSRDGEVDAWEGFASDISDEEDSPAELGAPLDLQTDDLVATTNRLLVGLDVAEAAEERRVRSALDQSMMSTLGGSRTNSHPSTVHNSVRDLKLSFPDPITSSRDELNRSYEQVFFAKETDSSVTTPDNDEAVPLVTASLPEEPLPQISADIILYGSPSVFKWTFAHDLLRKASLEKSGSSADGLIQWFTHKGDTDVVYAVHDKTETLGGDFTMVSQSPGNGLSFSSISSFQPSPNLPSDRPSLALVYLPVTPYQASIPEHTFYLPVHVHTGSDDTHLDGWRLLSISDDRIFPLVKNVGPIFAEDAALLEDVHVQAAFDLLVPTTPATHTAPAPSPAKKSPTSGFTLERFSSIHAVTLYVSPSSHQLVPANKFSSFALLSIIAGFVFNTSIRSIPEPPTPTADAVPRLWNVSNHTAIAVRTTTSLSVVQKPVARVLSEGHVSTQKGCIDIERTISLSRIQTISERMKSFNKEATPRAPSTTSEATPSQVPSQVLTEAMDPTPSASSSSFSTSSALSLRLVDSLSEIVESTAKALIHVAQTDFKELSAALDDLMNAVNTQVDSAVDESKNAAQSVHEHFVYRNERAKGKARKLKAQSDQLLIYVSDEFKARTNVAKQRAMSLKENVVGSHAWRSYSQTHKEWVSKLKKGDRDKVEGSECQRRHGRRKRSKGCRMATRSRIFA